MRTYQTWVTVVVTQVVVLVTKTQQLQNHWLLVFKCTNPLLQSKRKRLTDDAVPTIINCPNPPQQISGTRPRLQHVGGFPKISLSSVHLNPVSVKLWSNINEGCNGCIPFQGDKTSVAEEGHVGLHAEVRGHCRCRCWAHRGTQNAKPIRKEKNKRKQWTNTTPLP